jgi:AcrR family transcriptional regulator
MTVEKSKKTIRRKIDPDLRRRQILEAAHQVFARKGFAAATIPEIAGLAGVAAGTIYLYYPGKRELLVAVVEEMITIPLQNIFAREAGSDFLTILTSAFRDRVDLMRNDQIVGFVSLMGEILRDPELKKMYLERLVHPIMEEMEAYFSQPAMQNQINPIDPAILVRAIGGEVIGQIVLRVLEGSASPLNQIPPEKISEQMVRFVLYGVKGKPEYIVGRAKDE